MTATFETEIIVDPHVPLVRIVREFDAPPAKVFLAHIDPDLVMGWAGPNGQTCASITGTVATAAPTVTCM